MFLLLSYFHVFCDDKNNVLYFVAVPEPVAFYPLNARYEAAEKENRQPKGILEDVTITNGPYNEPGGAYMFYGTDSSYIEFPNSGGLDTGFSITLMCWVQQGQYNQIGPLFSYGEKKISIWFGKRWFGIVISERTITCEGLSAGKWVHVAANYDHNTGNCSLYINGHLCISQYIGEGYEISTTGQKARMGAMDEERWYFKGKIAEMKVYDVALNEAQIQTSIRQGS